MLSDSIVHHPGLIPDDRHIVEEFQFGNLLDARRSVIPVEGLQRRVEQDRECQLMGMSVLYTRVEIADGVVSCAAKHPGERKHGVVSR